jgi:hypothetical protein
LVGAVAGIDGEVRSKLRAGIPREERQALADLLLRLQKNIATACQAEVTQHSHEANGDSS